MTLRKNQASLWPSPDGNDSWLAFARKIVSRLARENREVDRFIERLSSALADRADVPKQPGQTVAARNPAETVSFKGRLIAMAPEKPRLWKWTVAMAMAACVIGYIWAMSA